jgi:hypothetical protein
MQYWTQPFQHYLPPVSNRYEAPKSPQKTAPEFVKWYDASDEVKRYVEAQQVDRAPESKHRHRRTGRRSRGEGNEHQSEDDNALVVWGDRR